MKTILPRHRPQVKWWRRFSISCQRSYINKNIVSTGKWFVWLTDETVIKINGPKYYLFFFTIVTNRVAVKIRIPVQKNIFSTFIAFGREPPTFRTFFFESLPFYAADAIPSTIRKDGICYFISTYAYYCFFHFFYPPFY
jgi:hypothetical protein